MFQVYHNSMMLSMKWKKIFATSFCILMIISDLTFILDTSDENTSFTISTSDSNSTTSSDDGFAKKAFKHWFNVIIGMHLIILVNGLVILGILFNIHLMLLPWLLLYFFGKFVTK